MLVVEESKLCYKKGEAIRHIVNKSEITANVERYGNRFVAKWADVKGSVLPDWGLLSTAKKMVPYSGSRMRSESVNWNRLREVGIFLYEQSVPTTLTQMVTDVPMYRVYCDRDISAVVQVGKDTITRRVKRNTPSGLIAGHILNRIALTQRAKIKYDTISFWADTSSSVCCDVAEIATGYVCSDSVIDGGYIDKSFVSRTNMVCGEIKNSLIETPTIIRNAVVINSTLRTDKALIEYSCVDLLRAKGGDLRITHSVVFDTTAHPNDINSPADNPITVINSSNVYSSSVKRSTLHNASVDDSNITASIVTGCTVNKSNLRDCNLHGADVINSKLKGCVGLADTLELEELENQFFQD